MRIPDIYVQISLFWGLQRELLMTMDLSRFSNDMAPVGLSKVEKVSIFRGRIGTHMTFVPEYVY